MLLDATKERPGLRAEAVRKPHGPRRDVSLVVLAQEEASTITEDALEAASNATLKSVSSLLSSSR
jgi:hypothetical protein